MSEIRNVFIKNNLGCYFSIELTDYSGMNPSKFFIMDRPEQEIPVPTNYALSIFVEPHARAAYERGDFVLTRNKDQFLRFAAEQGLTTIEHEKEVELSAMTPALILAVLKNGTEKKIVELLQSKDKDKTVQVAIDHKEELPMSTINLIEDELQMAIIND